MCRYANVQMDVIMNKYKMIININVKQLKNICTSAHPHICT
jgi:hypothetical protein